MRIKIALQDRWSGFKKELSLGLEFCDLMFSIMPMTTCFLLAGPILAVLGVLFIISYRLYIGHWPF